MVTGDCQQLSDLHGMSKMMRCSDLTYPVVCPEVRQTIVQEHRPSAIRSRQKPKHSNCREQCKIRNQDHFRLLWSKVWTIATQVKVTALPPRNFRHSWQREVVEYQIDRERDQLVEEQRNQSSDWAVNAEVMHCVPDRGRGLAIGITYHIHDRHERNITI